MHPFHPTKPIIRICGIVGRNGCIALQPSENDAVQRVKAGMKGIGIGLWTHPPHFVAYDVSLPTGIRKKNS